MVIGGEKEGTMVAPASAALPYRIAIRDSGSAQAITRWLDDHLGKDDFRVELLGVEELDDEDRKIRYVVRFRNRSDMSKFKAVWTAGAPGASGPKGAEPSLVKIEGWMTFVYLLAHPFGQIYVAKRPTR
jgi:hypothetical protein